MSFIIGIALLFLVHSGIAQQQGSLPVQLPQVDIEGRNDGTCPSAEVREQARKNTEEEIHAILRDTVVPILDPISTLTGRCPCGGPGPWRKIAHLNMSDPNQQCPPNWVLVTDPVRACGRANIECDSASFRSNASYSHVCGRISAIQTGSTRAFFPSIEGEKPGLEGAYVVGVSLTHGAVDSREHIWTFASALHETDPTYGTDSLTQVCSCTNTDFDWSGNEVPPFVGNSYFCDTGNTGPGSNSNDEYPDDPLWDGEGCGPTSTCCQLNNPPWFCTTLPKPTTDGIELRICGEDHPSNEDVNIQLVEIYTK